MIVSSVPAKQVLETRSTREEIDQRGIHFTLGKEIVPSLSEQSIDSHPGVEVIIARPAVDRVVAVLLVSEVQHVVPVSTTHEVVTVFAGDVVATSPAQHGVASRATVDHVTSPVAVKPGHSRRSRR